MAVEQPLYDVGLCAAAADLSALQYTAVVLTPATAFSVSAASTSGGKIYGVLQNKPTVGIAAQVRRAGITKMVCGATVAAGAAVMSDAAGKAITAATTGSTIIGQALEGGTVGQIITVDLLTAGVV